jgi:hypothetical protein
VSSTTADRSTVPAADLGVTRRDRVWLPRGLFLVAAALVVPRLALQPMHDANGAITARRVLNQSSLVPPAVAFGVVGLVVARRRPESPAGWIMLAIGPIWRLIAGAVSVERADEGGIP